MNLLFTTTSMSRFGGGLFPYVRRLAQELRNLQANIDVFAVADEYSQTDLSSWHPLSPRAFTPARPVSLGRSKGLREAVLSSSADLLHTHGIWQQPSFVALDWKHRKRRPHVASPHGMLEPWALKHNAWKKRPVWSLWEKRNMHSATVLHATSIQEASHLRGLGLAQPIAVSPPGIDLPPERERPSGGERIRQALFLSRIHPKKGLRDLVAAWNAVRPQGWAVTICGPDELNHRAEVEKLVVDAGLGEVFCFKGGVYGQERQQLYDTADLFILPSYSENFGIVVGEALASGVPVITTTETPWDCLEKKKCGWWVDCGVETLKVAVQSATSLGDDARHEMGKRGRRLVEEHFSWPRIASEMHSVYGWLLGRGEQPRCVVR